MVQAVDTLGQQALTVPLLLPRAQPLSETVTFVDAASAVYDISGDSWEAHVFDPNDVHWVGLNPSVSVVTNVITLTASAATIETAIATRQGLHWRLTNTSTGHDILAGPVVRDARGTGRRSATDAGITVKWAPTSITIQGPAATVVSGGVYAIDGAYFDTPAGAYVRDIDGGSL